MANLLPDDVRSLFEVYAMITSDKDLIDAVGRRIRAGQWAAAALRDVIATAVAELGRSEDKRIRARGEDFRAVGHHILLRLRTDRYQAGELPDRIILVGDEISIATIADVPTGKLAGVAAIRGSLLSHTAIVCRSLGIPSIFGLGDELRLERLDGAQAIIDGYSGRIFINPVPEVLREYSLLEREERALNASLEELQHLPAVTIDDVEVSLHVNLGLRTDVERARQMGISGVGLYRTELPFMLRDTFPGENDQVAIYRDVLEAFAPRPAVMRTLDIGADKALSYFPIDESNPALGWRGVRVTLSHPEIFITQLKAMLRANAELGNLKILIPMVSTLEEMVETRALLESACRILTEEALPFAVPPVGVMIEVPAAIYQIGKLARHADFFSIGTNDLTQYLLAVDRGNARVASLYDHLNPAVIRAVTDAVEHSHGHGKPISICGEMAGDPAGAILLIGMGVDGLSMSVASVPGVKQVIRSFSSGQTRALLGAALDADGPADVRRLLHDALDGVGLGGLIRAGL
jgi:phosphotransferase system enzyme I (PtsP)